MKFIWEPEDIRVGRKYSRPDITEEWLIGYLPLPDRYDARYVSISMNDGMVTKCASANEMAADLTRNNYVPIELISQMKK